MDCSPLAPLSMGFFRQGYWSGLPFSSPRDLLEPGIEPRSPKVDSTCKWTLLSELPQKPERVLDDFWGYFLYFPCSCSQSSFHSRAWWWCWDVGGNPLALGKQGSVEWVWEVEMKTSAWALLNWTSECPPEVITIIESHHSAIKMHFLHLLLHLLFHSRLKILMENTW